MIGEYCKYMKSPQGRKDFINGFHDGFFAWAIWLGLFPPKSKYARKAWDNKFKSNDTE